MRRLWKLLAILVCVFAPFNRAAIYSQSESKEKSKEAESKEREGAVGSSNDVSDFDLGLDLDFGREFGDRARDFSGLDKFSFDLDRDFGSHGERAREFSSSLDSFSGFLERFEGAHRGRATEGDLWELMGYVYTPFFTFSGAGIASGSTGNPLTVGGQVGQGASVSPLTGGLQLFQPDMLIKYEDGTVVKAKDALGFKPCTWIREGALTPETEVGIFDADGECTTDFSELKKPEPSSMEVEYVEVSSSGEFKSVELRPDFAGKDQEEKGGIKELSIEREVFQEYCEGIAESPSRALQSAKDLVGLAEKSVGAVRGNEKDREEVKRLAKGLGGILLGATLLFGSPPEYADEETLEEWKQKRHELLRNIHEQVGSAVEDFKSLPPDQQAKQMGKAVGTLVGDAVTGAGISKGFMALSKYLGAAGRLRKAKAAEAVVEGAKAADVPVPMTSAQVRYAAIAGIAKEVGVKIGAVKVLNRWKGSQLNAVVGRYLDDKGLPYHPWRPSAVVFELELTESSEWIRFVGSNRNPAGRWLAREKLVYELKQIKHQALKDGLSEAEMIKMAKEKVKDMLGLPDDFSHVANVKAKSGVRVLVGEANEMKSKSGVLRPGGEMQYELLDPRSDLLEWPEKNDVPRFEDLMRSIDVE